MFALGKIGFGVKNQLLLVKGWLWTGKTNCFLFNPPPKNILGNTAAKDQKDDSPCCPTFFLRRIEFSHQHHLFLKPTFAKGATTDDEQDSAEPQSHNPSKSTPTLNPLYHIYIYIYIHIYIYIRLSLSVKLPPVLLHFRFVGRQSCGILGQWPQLMDILELKLHGLGLRA